MIGYCCSYAKDPTGWCRTHQRWLVGCDEAFKVKPETVWRGIYNEAWWQILLRENTGWPPQPKYLGDLEYTGERVIPEHDEILSHLNYLTHCMEYEHVAKMLSSKMLVLDCACGVGYGSAILREKAGAVIGIDCSARAISHAMKVYRAPLLSFAVGDARELRFDDEAFDAVVTIETLEHFPEAELFLSEIWRVLKPGGLLYLTTPDGDMYPYRAEDDPEKVPGGKFHFCHYTRAQLLKLVRKDFVDVEVKKDGMNGCGYRLTAKKEE